MKDLVHVKAPGNWINDPNGFIYYKGKYHLFFQHFPYAPEWGTMHWGHTVSEDLVHWEYQGIALFPTKEYDQNGVFSGTALEEDGKLKIYYSAVKYLKPNPEDVHRVLDDAIQTSQAMIVSEDGFHFNNWDKKKVLPTVHDEEVGEPKMRDPKVWKDGDSYYMMMGSSYHDAGRVLFYTSKDGENWTYANQCRPESYGWTIECPDLFSQNDQWIFIGCPMRLTPGEKKYPDQAVWALVEFDPKTCELKLPDTHSYVDYGLDLYAPFEKFQGGCLDITAILYYVTVIVLFNFFTVQAIQKRRWSISKKTFSLSVFSSSFIVVVFALAVVANLAVDALPTRITSLDCSYSKLYSITKDTKKNMKKLKSDVSIYVLAAEKSKDAQIDSMLERYKDLSGHIRVKYVNPKSKPYFYKDYTDNAPTSNSLIVVSDKRSKVIDYYDIYDYQSNMDYSTYSYNNELKGFDAEGQIKRDIQYVTMDANQLPVVYQITGHDEATIGSAFSDVIIKSNMTLSSVEL